MQRTGSDPQNDARRTAPAAHRADAGFRPRRGGTRGGWSSRGHPTRTHFNPIGTIHGGWQATLLDSCMACAVQTQLEAGQAFTSLEIKINFLRAMTDKVGPVRAEGKVIQVGRQIGIAEGSLYDAAGKLYAHGTTTCLIFDHEQLRRT
ncbi:MAG: PaaI family thioesterase [Rhodocyclaceae bacterium]|nr:PaaI family thioesterase [Rhodocyclaceae bacterium]